MTAVLGLMLVFLTTSVLAMPAEEREETRIPILDSAEQFFGQRVNHLANDFDSFFATERADDELGRSRVRIRYNYTVQERALGRDDMQLRFNLKLPKLQDKFKFDSTLKKKKDGKRETVEERAKREEEYQKQHRVDERWIFNADTNLNASFHPHIILRGRARKSKETGSFIHRFVQEATWLSNADGFRQRTTLASDHSFTQTFLFRFNNTIDWRISRKNFTTDHGPALLHRLSDWTALSYAAIVSTTVEDSVLFMTAVTLAPTWRRDLYRKILYVDVTPGIQFLKQWHFRRTPYIFAQVEMLFGSN